MQTEHKTLARGLYLSPYVAPHAIVVVESDGLYMRLDANGEPRQAFLFHKKTTRTKRRSKRTEAGLIYNA